MLRQLTTDLLEKGRIETTVTRAKEVQPIAEKMITLGKGGTLADRRRALGFHHQGRRCDQAVQGDRSFLR